MSKKLPIEMGVKPLILIAEDDTDQSDMLRDAFEDAGFHVDVAFSGDVAFQRLLDRRYDLVVLDVRLPGMSGDDVLKTIRIRDKMLEVPVVIVTAFAADSDIERYIALGANACISKPYFLDELIEVGILLVGRGHSSHTPRTNV